MSNSKIPKAIFSWLIIFSIILLVSGCARWPDGPGPEPGEPKYQLKITVEVKGEINTYDGIYYIVFYADRVLTGPGPNVNDWEGDFYYVKLDSMDFHFIKVKDGSESSFYGKGNEEGNSLQVIVALSDLENPENININVITTNSNNYTYDSLDDGYFTINTNLGSKPPINDQEGDLEDGGVDFDIVNVTAVITTY